MKFKKALSMTLMLVMVIAALCSCSSGGGTQEPGTGTQEGWEPTKTPVFIAAAAAGSGYDTSARNFAKALNETGIVKKSIKIENIAGGAGAVGFAQFGTQYVGDPNTLIACSAATITASIGSKWEVTYKDFTPIARLITDYVVLVTSADNTEYETIESVIEKLKSDPGSIKIGGAAPPDPDYIGLVFLLQAIGVDPMGISYAVYDGGGELVPAMMGGHIDIAVSTGSEWTNAVESGQLKALAVFAPERLGGVFADAPTLAEKGYDVEFGSWRGLWGPKDMPEEAVEYWQNACEKVVETEEWEKVCENMQWTPNLMTDGFDQWVAEFHADIESAMKAANIIQ